MYGLLLMHEQEVIEETYVGNDVDTKFRIFSCSKPITAMAILMLAQRGSLRLDDTLSKFDIDIPYSNRITIWHLLTHTSNVHDVSSELYFERTPLDLFNSIIDLQNGETRMIGIEKTVELIKATPATPPDGTKIYNNTGYDLLGYINELCQHDFIRSEIFAPLNMTQSGFQHERDPHESVPYESICMRGIKEQQNWYCGNGNIVCTLRDYAKFLQGYRTLLNDFFLSKFEDLLFFEHGYFTGFGAGDFSRSHAIGIEEYDELSRSIAIQKGNIILIISENYVGSNGFSKNHWKRAFDLLNFWDRNYCMKSEGNQRAIAKPNTQKRGVTFI